MLKACVEHVGVDQPPRAKLGISDLQATGPLLVLNQQICPEPLSVTDLVLHALWPRDHLQSTTSAYSAHWPISLIGPLGPWGFLSRN